MFLKIRFVAYYTKIRQDSFQLLKLPRRLRRQKLLWYYFGMLFATYKNAA